MPRAQPRFSAALAVIALVTVATPALAQQPPGQGTSGLRYLAWPGKTTTQAPVAARPMAARPAARAPSEPSSTRPRSAPTPAPVRRPSPVIPHGGTPASSAVTSTAAVPSQRGGLTPANAWMRPAVTMPAPAPVAAPGPMTSAPDVYARPAAPIAAPQMPEYLPEPARIAAPELAPEPAPVAVADPMAPRRDAPVFRMQGVAADRRQPAPDLPSADRTPQPQPQPQPASQPQPRPTASSAPSQQGAVYYSVHRQNGRQPDSIPLPAPFFLDSAPVDLAEPPAQPALMRNAEGRVQAVPATDEPTLP